MSKTGKNPNVLYLVQPNVWMCTACIATQQICSTTEVRDMKWGRNAQEPLWVPKIISCFEPTATNPHGQMINKKINKHNDLTAQTMTVWCSPNFVKKQPVQLPACASGTDYSWCCFGFVLQYHSKLVMFLVLGVCSFSEKCVFCNTQGFNRIYIHHVRSNQTNGTVHAHKHHDIGEKRFFAESSGNMQSVYSKQTQIHHNITSMMLYVDELSSKCYCLFIFSARTKSVDSSESYNKIQVLLSIQLERIFPPLHFAQKKTNKSKSRPWNNQITEYCNRGVVLHVVKDFGGKVREITKKKCIFSRFFRTMPRFLTRPIWRVPSANPQTICEWVTPNPPSSLRKFQIFDFFQEKMQTPSLWYIFGIVFRNAFEKIPGFPRRRYEKNKTIAPARDST